MSSPLAGALIRTFFAPAVEVGARLVGVGEDAGRLEDDVDAEGAPGQGRRITLLEDLDLAPVDDQRVLGVVDRARVRSVGRVVLEQERVELRVDQVVDGDHLDLGGALDERLERLATDPAEAVDPDPNGHRGFLPWASRSRGLDCGWAVDGRRTETGRAPDVGRSLPACQSYDAGRSSGHGPSDRA